ncbi:DUF2304 domain-containing protein [candidate division CSSED10-310 bacterium]|uniref:DUF2304 domain-containing protein n=1 Tax=candidate division CSSED10-310 bacterium TaxID=2855610 RepID=A0ABV6YWC1_UNCC1
MTLQQKVFAVLISFSIFVTIIYLVKKGKLREEYSWLWLLTGVILLVLVLRYDFLLFLTKMIGAVLPTTTLFIFGIIFVMLLSLHFAIKISLLTEQVKNLGQKVSLLQVQQDQAQSTAGSKTDDEIFEDNRNQ